MLGCLVSHDHWHVHGQQRLGQLSTHTSANPGSDRHHIAVLACVSVVVRDQRERVVKQVRVGGVVRRVRRLHAEPVARADAGTDSDVRADMHQLHGYPDDVDVGQRRSLRGRARSDVVDRACDGATVLLRE